MTNVLLIDLSSIAHPIYHLTADDPNPNAMSIAVLDRIRGLAHGQPNTAIACDSKRSIRKEADPTYKANRPKEDRAALYHQIDLVMDALKAEGFPLWSVDGYEADDVIASATGKALETPNVAVQIVSADKDLLALVGDRVTMKSLKDGAIITADVVKQKFGVTPAQIPDYLCLVGDASDNIKGAAKIGPVTAVKLLGAHGTLEALYEAWLNNPEALTPAIYESLKEFWPRVDDVLNLIHLHADLPIPFEEIAVERPTPMFDAPDAGFSFDADPTGPMPVPEPKPAPPVVVPAPVPEPVVEAAPPAPAPARRRRIAPVAAPAPDLEDRPTIGNSTLRVSVERMKEMQAEAAQVEQLTKARQNEAAPKPKPIEVIVDEAAKRLEAKPAPEEQRRKDPTMEPQATALVPQVIDVDYTRQLEPRTMTEATTLARYAFESRMFGAYGTAQGVLMTIMAGRELGMPTMHALRAFHMVDGKPVLAADAIRALILRSGLAKYFRCTERTPERATFVTRRGSDPEISLTYSMSEAQAAGLVRPGSGWTKNGPDMLVARAGSKLARLVYPDVVHGVYTPEELEG